MTSSQYRSPSPELTSAQRRSTASNTSSWCPIRVTPSSSRSWWEICSSCSPFIFSRSNLWTYCCRQSSNPTKKAKKVHYWHFVPLLKESPTFKSTSGTANYAPLSDCLHYMHPNLEDTFYFLKQILIAQLKMFKWIQHNFDTSFSAKRVNTNPCWFEMPVIDTRHRFVCLPSSLPLGYHPSLARVIPVDLPIKMLCHSDWPPYSISQPIVGSEMTMGAIKIFPDIWYINIGRQRLFFPFQLEIINTQPCRCWQSFFWSVS